ncbi:kinase-like domain-containing protein [Mycena polygramma]|nr:kinase-like domain-containing protein [Mycena polygramma]
MYQSSNDSNYFRRYFSTDGGEHNAPPVVTDGLGGGDSDQDLSLSPLPESSVIPSSPAALFLSAFSQAAAPVLEPDAEGQVVGGFTLGPIFAHGGFSTIRRATSATGAIVAVKVVPKQKDRGAARRMAHEEAVWSSLSHEHILPLFACVHTPSTTFFVTQLCPAGSLFDIMRGGVPAREDTGRMFRQIVRGLRYLHTEKRLVHRDVKLENVLVDEAGVCRVADFGMARGMDEGGEWADLDRECEEPPPEPAGVAIGVHRSMSLAVPRSSTYPRRDRPSPSPTTTTEEFQPGSLPYAAPELLGPPPLTSSASVSGKSKASALANAGKSASAFVAGKSASAFVSTPKTSTATTIASSKHPAPAQDIWALGVLLYALLMGRLPFIDPFEPRLVLKILGCTYVPPTNVNARTLAILHGCLAPRVHERWPVERVDEAAWAVGGEDTGSSPGRSDDEEQQSHHRPRKPAVPPLDLDGARPPLVRGRPDAAARRASDRAERSSSRAPYTATRTQSRPDSAVRRSLSRSATAESSSRSLSRSATEESSQSQSHSNSHSRGRSRSKSRSRSQSCSPSPRTPVDSLPPLGLMAIGLGFPPGKGPGRFGGAGSGAGSGEGRGAGAATSEEGEGEADGLGLALGLSLALGESLLLSPEGEGEGAARRAGSMPPVAWRGGGPGAGRSRSLSGTGTGG